MAKNEEPRFNLEYPELTARRYGIMIRQDGNLTLVDPVEFMLAAAFLTSPSALVGYVRAYAESRAEAVLYDAEKAYTLKIGRGETEFITRKAVIGEFSPDEIVFGLEEKLRDAGEHKLWWSSPERAIAKQQREGSSRLETHAGGVVLVGKVAAKSHGWNKVEITGPFASSAKPLQKIICECEDSRYVRLKLGSNNLTHVDFHAAVLLSFAAQHPERIAGFEKQQRQRSTLSFFLPFHATPELMVETLIARYVAGMAHPDITQKLLEEKVTYDERLLAMVRNGAVTYEVLPNRDFTNIYSGELMNLYNKIRGALYEKGFRLGSYVYEKKGTAYEVVALEFEKRAADGSREVMRVVTAGDPPLIVKRRIPAGNNVQRFSSYKIEDRSIWQELYLAEGVRKPLHAVDDETRMKTPYEVILPIELGISVPDHVFKDYGIALQHHFKDNLGEFQRRLYQARAEGRLENGLFGRIMAMTNKR